MKLASAVAISLCIITVSTSAGAQRSSCAPAMHKTMNDSAVVAFETAWAAAAVAHDTSALRCVLTNNFVDTSWQGALRTRRDVLASGPVTPSGLTQHFSDWRIDRFDGTVIVRGLNTVTGADGKPVSALRFTDVLRYLDGRWQAVAAQETPVRQ